LSCNSWKLSLDLYLSKVSFKASTGLSFSKNIIILSDNLLSIILINSSLVAPRNLVLLLLSATTVLISNTYLFLVNLASATPVLNLNLIFESITSFLGDPLNYNIVISSLPCLKNFDFFSEDIVLLLNFFLELLLILFNSSFVLRNSRQELLLLFILSEPSSIEMLILISSLLTEVFILHNDLLNITSFFLIFLSKILGLHSSSKLASNEFTTTWIQKNLFKKFVSSIHSTTTKAKSLEIKLLGMFIFENPLLLSK